jgi:hypothetical protein
MVCPPPYQPDMSDRTGTSDPIVERVEQWEIRQLRNRKKTAKLDPEIRAAVNHFATGPYPLHGETAAAIEAATPHFVLPWSVIRSRFIKEWALDHYTVPRLPFGCDDFLEYVAHRDDLPDLSDFSASCKLVEFAMTDLIFEGAVTAGMCAYIETIPFNRWGLKLAPLREDQWIDRHFLELAEFTTLLGERGYRRSPAWDPHHLAWERFRRSGSDRSTPPEAESEVLEAGWTAARKCVRGFPGRWKPFNRRRHLHFDDYRAWRDGQRNGQPFGSVSTAAGVIVQSWNAWVMSCWRQARSARLEDIAVNCLNHWRMLAATNDMHPITDDRRFCQVLAHRNGVLEFLARAIAPQIRFVPSPLQQRIMRALNHRQLTSSQLEDELGSDHKQMFREWGLRGLMKQGLVANNGDRKGYYRPDARPPLFGRAPSS